MKKIIGFATLIFCLSFSCLHAQEISGQGWTASEPGQRSSSMGSLVVTGGTRDSAHPSLKDLVPAPVSKGNMGDRMSPFPVLMPKTVTYPRKAIRNGWEGQTVVAAEVLSDGSVGRMALAKSSGHEVLDRAAQEAIKTWKFATEFANDAAIPRYVDIPVLFKLEDHGEE
jgi:TonB family protein